MTRLIRNTSTNLSRRLIASMLCSFALVTGGCGLEYATPVQRTLSVQGVGTVAAQPDIAVVRLGVDTRETTSRDTLNLNSEKTRAIISALTALGVSDQDIKTESLQLHPRYEHLRDNNGRSNQRLVGYRASNVISVRLSDLASAGDAIDAANQAGANRIDSIAFEISDPSRALEQAREAAWSDARKQAEQLANLAGAELGPVQGVSTFEAAPGPVEDMQLARVAMESVPVSGGKQTVSVQIQVRWSLVATNSR